MENWKAEMIAEAIDDLAKARALHDVEAAMEAMRLLTKWMVKYVPPEMEEEE